MAERTRARTTKGGSAPSGVLYPAKVDVPARIPAIVHRERLISALSEIPEKRVIIVTAPAGYGKTTLLSEFALSRKEPVCWLSIDERDVDPATFLQYFLEAGARLFPGFNAGAEAVTGKLTAAAITDILVTAVRSANADLIFILDDFHELDKAPTELWKGVEGWLARMPDTCHVILAGRTQPQLAPVPALITRQQAKMVRASDFAFTVDEVANLFRDVLHKEISLDDSQQLANLSEGWAGAIVLMGQAYEPGRRLPALERLNKTDTLYQYITLEQVEPQPEDMKKFLEGTSVLLTMDAETADQLLGIDDSEVKIDQLLNLNLITPCEDDPTSYRYHRLLRASLIHRFRSSDPKRFRQVNEKAASLREHRLKWEDAVYHLIQAGSWNKVVEVTGRVGQRMIEEGRWDTLADWLENVPPEALAAEPRLLLWKARTYRYLNQLDRALALVAEGTEMFEARDDKIGLAEAMMTKGTCLRVKGDYSGALDVLLQAKAVLEEHEASVSLLYRARMELGLTLGRAGALNEAIQELNAVVAYYESQGDKYNIAVTTTELAAYLGESGRVAEAIIHLERARSLCEDLNNSQFLLQVLNNLGTSYYWQGDFAKAEEIFQRGLEKAKASGSLKEEVYLLTCLADVRKDTGEHKLALDTYTAALDDAWAVSDAYIRVYLMDAIADSCRLLGNLTDAISWAERAKVEAEKTGGALELGICLLTEGLIMRQQEEHKAAIDCLERAVPFLRDKGAHRELAIAYFQLACIYFAINKKRLCLDALETCAEIVKELGYDHFLMLEAQRNPLVIQYAAANKLADGYYTRMLKLIKTPGNTAAAEGEAEAGDDSTADAIRVSAFGHAAVWVRGREVTDLEWRSEKGKEMFFFFLANRRPLRKEEIVTALWPDLPDEKTTSAFHSNMYRLRKALYQEVIAKDSGRYALDPNSRFIFDVEEFQDALARADDLKGSPEAIPLLEKAASLYQGQFAPDFYTEWAENLRWQLEEQHMGLLSTLAGAYNATGEFKKSADVCQRIIELDEYNEAGWYRLMSNYVQSGQVEAAKYCYNRYVQILAKDEEMDDEAPEFDDLVAEIKGGDLRM